ncbi:thiamine-phosphate kinase [Metallosphaera hakonensis]|uniref:Thiamine-monophosphate kinase n=1 Tax=Metallosphaera hakonensis JCM 8857 = DSM 7519 TaxID=1293036 RepID=A0A2U9IU24_9CREN|nr:thiamine-phosphate kinase [Metallosphaera hakonensis]AWR99485.1 thiamine-monophosphate kinase [Metallosphaera hakonensis JCM 8857 = DSM 7519]
MKLRELGEHRFIEDILSQYVSSNVNLDVYEEGGIGLKIDGFPIKYTFPFMDFYDIGWKAVIAVMSDLLSYGVKPSVVLVSFGLNPDMEVDDAKRLVMGVNDASRYYGSSYGGGDTNSSTNSGWIDVSAFGNIICKERPKSAAGDLIFVTGKLGYTTSVFLWYNSGGKFPLDHESMLRLKHPIVNRALLKVHQKLCDTISLGTDISDGIMVSLDKIARYVGYGIKLDYLPLTPHIKAMIDNKVITLEDVLKISGEEYETIFVVKKEKVSQFLEVINKIGIEIIKIGELVDNYPQVSIGPTKQEIHGWDNFKGWF